MTHCFYQIGGQRIRVSVPETWMYTDHGYLTAFLAEQGEADRFLEFFPVDQLSPPEGEQLFAKPDRQVFGLKDRRIVYVGSVAEGLGGAYLRISREGTVSRIESLIRAFPFGMTSVVVMNAMELEHLTAKNRGFLLHASFIRWRDRAVLFTAPSGTGKSTQAELWRRECGAELINGDRAIVRMEGDMALACGVPFCGSSGVSKNVALPLAAIVCLSQAPETRISPLSGFQAFRRIWEGCSVNVWDRTDLSACSQTVLDVLSTVPVYHLACTPDLTAVNALRRALE